MQRGFIARKHYKGKHGGDFSRHTGVWYLNTIEVTPHQRQTLEHKQKQKSPDSTTEKIRVEDKFTDVISVLPILIPFKASNEEADIIWLYSTELTTCPGCWHLINTLYNQQLSTPSTEPKSSYRQPHSNPNGRMIQSQQQIATLTSRKCMKRLLVQYSQ